VVTGQARRPGSRVARCPGVGPWSQSPAPIRHTKVSYTLCLGGLSFFLFILLTVTGIFLMFFYRPTAAQAWDDIYTLQTSVTFGLLVRNMHRWAAYLMVITVFLHMARVFYHGAYKPPREFNWVIGVILLLLTLLLSFTGYLLPWDQLALWAVTVGTNMMGYTPVFGDQVRFVLLGGAEIGTDTLLRWYVLHVLLLPFVIVIFLATTSGGSARMAASPGRYRTSERSVLRHP
jgi:quinol---cytochrome c reductase cytochrome b subunit, bacillus type